MSFLDKILRKKKSPVRLVYTPSVYVGPPDNQKSYIDNGYFTNDILYSVIQVILDKISVATWGLYKVEDETELKRYNSIMSRKDISQADYTQAKISRRKSLTPITRFGLKDGRLKDLLIYPNENEPWVAFILSGMVQKLLTGNKYIWGSTLDAGANKGLPSQLIVLPSADVTLKIDDGFPPKVTMYDMYSYGQSFLPVDIIHERYTNPKWSANGGQHYGVSPIKSAISGTIARNNSAVKASAWQYKNRGIEDLLYLNTPVERDIKEGSQWANTMKHKISHEWVGETNSGKIEVSPYPMGSIKLGLSSKELQIIDSEKWDVVKICNIYGVPAALFSTEVMTLDNLKVAEKALTNRCALPELVCFRDMLNWKLKTDWGFRNDNIYVDFDMTVYSELASDMKEVASWVSMVSQYFTPNEIREQFGFEGIDIPQFNEPWITQQMGQPLSEWQMNPVETALNYDGQGAS